MIRGHKLYGACGMMHRCAFFKCEKRNRRNRRRKDLIYLIAEN